MSEVLVKSEDVTDPQYGCPPDKRSVEELLKKGVINLDKPRGPTSHQVAAWVKDILRVKTGHGGTLDPAVSGCLPIFLGSATRLAEVMLLSTKEYVCLMRLHKHAAKKDIMSLFSHFQGQIWQRPPVKSSVKRELRKREIYGVEVLEIEENDVLFRISCEAGTYIRKYCLHPETEIISSDSLFLAKDVARLDSVYSKQGKEICKMVPSESQQFDFNGCLVKFTTSSGITFSVTPGHKMLVALEDGYVMKRADTLKTSDFIVKSLECPLPEINPAISDLLDDGYLVQQNDIKKLVKDAFIHKYGSIRSMYRELSLDRKAFLKKSKSAIPLGHVRAAGIYKKVKHEISEFKTEKGIVISMAELSPDIMYLMGLIASDGNNTKEKGTKRYTRIKFHNTNESLIETFLRKYRSIFPNFNITKMRRKDGVIQLDTSNSLFATMCASLGLKSPQKESDLLPIVCLKKDLVIPFLRGYFDGDGSAYIKKNANSTTTHNQVAFFTVNGVNAKRLHQMLLKIGIPNKIFKRKDSFVIAITDMSAKRRFISLVGSDHPLKKGRLKLIERMRSAKVVDTIHIGMHYKEYLRRNRAKLHKMGGNLDRILDSLAPITRGFYMKASKLVKLPALDKFCVEKIKAIEHVPYTGRVYDITIPKTHNFLIETGFVSSNCHDFGLMLGTEAHMQELRRVKSGVFKEGETLVTLQDLKDAYVFWREGGNDKFIRRCVMPMEVAVEELPKVWVRDSAIDSLCHGSDLAVPGIVRLEKFGKGRPVAMMSLKGELVAIGRSLEATEDIMRAKKGFVVAADKVFMEPGTYPRGWKKSEESGTDNVKEFSEGSCEN